MVEKPAFISKLPNDVQEELNKSMRSTIESLDAKFEKMGIDARTFMGDVFDELEEKPGPIKLCLGLHDRA